ncbi:type 4a pilus biogenesis protein PilO [Patescibacteria group bacterium]|nr:type 4a pilus biogenesis protein PilO [Patescibacteria group bacterium]
MTYIHNLIIKLSIYTILVLFFSISLILFLTNKIQNKSDELHEKRSILRVSQQQDSNFLELKNSYHIVENNLEKIEGLFPNADNIQNFIISLENTATQTNNQQILNFPPLESAKNESTNLKSISFSIFLTGNMNTFIEYLNKVKKLTYFIDIESINLSNNTGVSFNDSKMNIKAKIYIRK